VHVSKVSGDHAALLVREIRPDQVVLELCKSRLPILFAGNFSTHSTSQIAERSTQPTVAETIEKVKAGEVFQALLSYVYGKISSQLEVVPGIEFKMAFEEVSPFLNLIEEIRRKS
jgi:pheromone shutdown protein TraB